MYISYFIVLHNLNLFLLQRLWDANELQAKEKRNLDVFHCKGQGE